MISYYNIERHSKKRWKRVYSYVWTVLNAYVLESHAKLVEHALQGRHKRDFLCFRLELAEELFGIFRSR